VDRAVVGGVVRAVRPARVRAGMGRVVLVVATAAVVGVMAPDGVAIDARRAPLVRASGSSPS
jgi:hypothetical protein